MENKGKCVAEIRRRKPDSRNSETQEWDSWNSPLRLRACFKISRRPAARDFGRDQGGLGGAQRPAAGCKERANAGHEQKTRRPKGFRAKGRLASLLLGHRPLAGMLPRRASPPGLLPENRPPATFKAGSQGKSSLILAYSRLFSLMFAYLRLMEE